MVGLVQQRLGKCNRPLNESKHPACCRRERESDGVLPGHGSVLVWSIAAGLGEGTREKGGVEGGTSDGVG